MATTHGTSTILYRYLLIQRLLHKTYEMNQCLGTQNNKGYSICTIHLSDQKLLLYITKPHFITNLKIIATSNIHLILTFALLPVALLLGFELNIQTSANMTICSHPQTKMMIQN